jgi:hypothetical protein
MATSTLVQYLETSAVSGLGVTTALGPSTMDRSQTETFLSGAAITKGDWVAFDTTQSGANRVLYVKQAATVATAGNALVVGVALNTTTAVGEKVQVCVSGYCPYANVDAAVVAGSPLCGPITTAGRADVNVAAALSGLVGVALDADGVSPLAANYAPVFVAKRF